MGSLLSSLSAIWKGINLQTLAIVALLILGVAATYVYNKSIEANKRLINQVSVLESSLDSQKKLYSSAIKDRDALRLQAVSDAAKLNAYQSILRSNQTALDELKSQLNKDKQRESVVAKKPGLVAEMTKKSYNSLEDDFACISGNMDACLRVHSSSPGVLQKKWEQPQK